jgi:hypothetical protein
LNPLTLTASVSYVLLSNVNSRIQAIWQNSFILYGMVSQDNLARGMDKLPYGMRSRNIARYNYTPVPSLKYSFSVHELIQYKSTEI